MSRRILIVDDNKTDLFVLSGILEKEYSLDTAENGQEAISILQNNPHRYSAVVTDILMPVIDGYELVRQIRENDLLRPIPIILVTNETDEQSLYKAVSCGANAFTTKPFNGQLLLAMLKNNINLRESSVIDSELNRDKLTGIMNREAFFREVSKRIPMHEADYYVMAAFDIDKFKVINDQYGTLTGDKVLQYVANTVVGLYDSVDGICCRISDDKFAAFFPAKYIGSGVFNEIRNQAMSVPFLSAPLSFCVGRYIVTDLSLSPSIMYDRAAMAAGTIKHVYEKKIAYYDSGMRDRLLREQSIISDMERALLVGEFEPWYQPQYNHSTGAMIGSEALVRWRKDDKIIQPFEFIDLFEKNGFIYRVDQYMWRKVCENLHRWLKEGRSPIPVSVNISRYDLFQHGLVSTICSLIEEYGIPIDLLRLEITESAFSESPQQIVSTVTQLIEYGFTVEIDDFGSGYSSLNVLKDVPAQILKLDMRFLEVGNSDRGGNIIESIIRMAKWLGMSVIAEGVETIQQADYLRSVGCFYMQGYLYAKPMPLDQYEVLCDGCKKEVRLSALETVENLDTNSFWDPQSIDTLIFSSYIGAACIFEYFNGNIELVRINQKYAETVCKDASSEEIFEANTLNRMDTSNRDILLNCIKHAIESNEESVCETVEQDIKNANELVYIRSAIRVVARAGERYLLYSMLINTTQQHVAEERIREAAEVQQRALTEMQTMMADMPGGFVRIRIISDTQFKVTYFNDGFCKLTGMDAATLFDCYSGDPLAVVHPEDFGIVQAALIQMLEKGEAQSSRYRLLHANSSYIWVTVFGRYTQDQDGKSYLNLYYSDVTESAKEEVQQKMLLDNLPCGAGIYELTDSQLNLVYQNKSYWDLVGLQEEGFCHDDAPMSAIYPDDVPTIMRELSAAIEEDRTIACDIRLRHFTLGYRPVHLSGRIVRRESGGFLIFATFALIAE